MIDWFGLDGDYDFTDDGEPLPEPTAALLAGLKQMIEAGRLTAADIPDDFEWLCDAMARAGRKVKPPQPL